MPTGSIAPTGTESPDDLTMKPLPVEGRPGYVWSPWSNPPRPIKVESFWRRCRLKQKNSPAAERAQRNGQRNARAARLDPASPLAQQRRARARGYEKLKKRAMAYYARNELDTTIEKEIKAEHARLNGRRNRASMVCGLSLH